MLHITYTIDPRRAGEDQADVSPVPTQTRVQRSGSRLKEERQGVLRRAADRRRAAVSPVSDENGGPKWISWTTYQ